MPSVHPPAPSPPVLPQRLVPTGDLPPLPWDLRPFPSALPWTPRPSPQTSIPTWALPPFPSALPWTPATPSPLTSDLNSHLVPHAPPLGPPLGPHALSPPVHPSLSPQFPLGPWRPSPQLSPGPSRPSPRPLRPSLQSALFFSGPTPPTLPLLPPLPRPPPDSPTPLCLDNDQAQRGLANYTSQKPARGAEPTRDPTAPLHSQRPPRHRNRGQWKLDRKREGIKGWEERRKTESGGREMGEGRAEEWRGE